MTTAEKHLTNAHTAVLAMAEQASAVLASYEGTGATLSYADPAGQLGLDLRSLGQTDTWLVFMALDSAVAFRSWVNLAAKGEPARFTRPPSVTEFKRQNERNPRRARA